MDSKNLAMIHLWGFNDTAQIGYSALKVTIQSKI